MQEWKNHFEKLLNGQEQKKEENQNENVEEEEIEKPNEKEVQKAIATLKNNKRPGISEIAAEMLKAGGELLQKKLCNIIQNIWEIEEMPSDWAKALICPIYKKGEKLMCQNYRGIALQDTCYKVLARIIRERLNNCTEGVIGEYQAGFRCNRSVTDQIFTIKEIQTTCYEYKTVIYGLFVDFKQAYDRINREGIYEAMRDIKIPTKLIRLVKMTLKNTSNQVIWEGHRSEEFEVNQGLRQGDPLSTVLFNVVLEAVIRKSKVKTNGTIYNNEHQCIAFADDLTILAKSKKELERITKSIELEAKRYGLQINETKTKYMVMGNTQQEPEEQALRITSEGKVYKFEKVKNVTYLGVILDEKGKEDLELKARIAKGNKKNGSLKALLKSKSVSRKTKERIYKTVIRPTVTYACETWVLRKEDEEMLERWERKMLRIIYGGINTDEGWRRRTNKELELLFNDAKISNFVKAQRVRWLGHVERMGRERMPKMILNRRPIGKKRIGRPRKRWYESVIEDLRNKQISDWKEKATDRGEWKRLVKSFLE